MGGPALSWTTAPVRFYRDWMTDPSELREPHCPTCGQPLRHGDHLQPENAALVTVSGNAGITFETQGRCENEACADFGSEFAPEEWLERIRGE